MFLQDFNGALVSTGEYMPLFVHYTELGPVARQMAMSQLCSLLNVVLQCASAPGWELDFLVLANETQV